MATVTGFTAERMQQIEDETIVDGTIVGSDLILKRRDDVEINAGTVVGPPGEQGPPGTDPSIVIVTSGTRPSGVDLFDGLHIWETDTKRLYVYDGTNWVYRYIGAWVCTSGTRPSGADLVEGLRIWETDTEREYIYDGEEFRLLITKKPKSFAVDNVPSPFSISSTTGVDWKSADPFDVPFTKLEGSGKSNIHVRLAYSAFYNTAGYLNITAGVKIAGTNYWSAHGHVFNVEDCHAEFTDYLVISGINAGAVTMRAVMKKFAAGQDAQFDVSDFFRIEYEEVAI